MKISREYIERNVRSTLKMLTLTLLLTLGAIYVQGAWTGPTDAPPLNNVDPPINVGNQNQVKNASIGADGLYSFLDVCAYTGSANEVCLSSASPKITSIIECSKSFTGVAAGQQTVTFTAADCGGESPGVNYVGLISSFQGSNGCADVSNVETTVSSNSVSSYCTASGDRFFHILWILPIVQSA